MTVQVTALYFAKSAELTGLKEEELVAVPTPITSRGLWELLLRRHPRVRWSWRCVSSTLPLATRRWRWETETRSLWCRRSAEDRRRAIVLMEDQRDAFRLSRDWLSVQEVVDAVNSASCGAVSVFIGTTREDEVGGRKVVGLEYEAYEPMAQSEFTKLCADIRTRWPPVKHICVHHRLGWVKVGEASVVMAISSPHRQEGQQAIQHAISQLKATIPIWKKEVYDTKEISWKENSECPWSSQEVQTKPAA